MKLNTLLTTSIISLALLSGCDKGSEQQASTTGENATPAIATPAPAATTAPAETTAPAVAPAETAAPAPAATPAPAETATPATAPASVAEEAK
jgi:hypothetical protein